MAWNIRLKTGFYETTDYELSVIEGGLRFIPANAELKETIEIDGDDLVSIILTHKKNSEIEIRTKNIMLTGVLPEDVDLREICQVLKMQTNTKITYEEEE